MIFEVCVDSIDSAKNAIDGGAGRIELCSALATGGLTPSNGLLKKVKEAAGEIPVFAMIRPRDGDYCYTQADIEVMESELVELKAAGADGFVFGLLNLDGTVDEQGCKRLLRLAAPLPCTFHKAFDVSNSTLQTLIDLGFQRVLTSGKSKDIMQGIPEIQKLMAQSEEKIIILPGGGVTCENVAEIVERTGTREIHGSFSLSVKSIVTYRPNEFERDFQNGGYFTRKTTDTELLKTAREKALVGMELQQKI